MKSAFFSLYQYIKKTLLDTFSEHIAEQYTWSIMSHVFSTSKTDLITDAPEITETHKQKVSQILHELITLKKPIAYIIGSVPFLDLTLQVRPPVLIPRPETESLMSALISMLQPYSDHELSILDIGTGSGCIALSCAYYFPQFHIYATDISDEALAVCRENAQKNHISKVTMIKSNLFSKIQKTDFDLIISNPPYISASEFQYLDDSVKNWEDISALVADDDGFALLSAIIATSPKYTRKESILAQKNVSQLIVEMGQTQGKKVAELMHQAGYQNVSIWKDQYQKDRAVFGANLS